MKKIALKVDAGRASDGQALRTWEEGLQKSHATIHPTLLGVYRDTLNRIPLDRLEDTANALEDIGIVDEDILAIRMIDLPKAVPETVRRELVALSKEYVALGRRLQNKLDTLFSEAVDTFDDRQAEEMAKRPKCECCDQVLPVKKTSRRR